jgi:AraC-like DNA-binding protein
MSSPAPTLTRYESRHGWYELSARDPAPPLRPDVLTYWGREARSVRPVARLEVPYPAVIVSVTFGPKERVGASSHGSFVAGLHERTARIEHNGHVFGVQLALSPPAAHVLFRTPMHALASQTVELDDLFGAEAGRLAERLHETPTWAARFDVLDRFLGERLAAAPPPSPQITWAWRRLERTGGGYSIGRLAAELDWSRKRLVRRFREGIGLAPKTVARVLRFHHAVKRLAGAEERWSDIAIACGYYDQAHFNRDFREFAGMTPTEFVRRLSPDDPGVTAN